MSAGVKSYEHDGFTVEYLPERCIHAAECVRGLPLVFDPERRPWIDPSQADPDAIVETIRRCPTGALHYQYSDGSPQEEPDVDVTIEVVLSGPLYVRGDVRLAEPDGQVTHETRVALCRCGASQNKPFCDNSHIAAGFDDAGTIGESKLAPADGSETPGVDITPAPNGPLLMTGRIDIIGADQQQIFGGRGALCRCGASGNKPFCDGSHLRIKFETDKQERTNS